MSLPYSRNQGKFIHGACFLIRTGVLALTLTAVHARADEGEPITTGLPSSREAYQRQRGQLMEIDRSMGFDAGMRLNAAERRVDAYLGELRSQLVKQYRDQRRFPPAEPFHRVKAKIQQTRLYQVLGEMPKGGVLHIHTSSTAPASWIVDTAIREPNCYVCWPDDRGDAIRGQLGFFRPDQVPPGYLRQQETTLPFYFHDGESDWPKDDNLYDAYLLGNKRIGHGFNLFRFPDLAERLIADGVAVEVCPISNQELRYVADLRIHPAAGYLNHGIPCVLGNDDPGILGNDGLSYDYWEVVMAWNLDLRAIKQLAFNSLAYSAMTDEEKPAAIERWERSWDRWISRVDGRIGD